jgi:DNA-directed RNA polymerase specialized sigma24 family protein
VVQQSLVKALRSDRKPTGDEAMTAWFCRTLRRSIIDLDRRRNARRLALDRLEQELSEVATPQGERILCQCFKRLLPLVPEQYREVLQQTPFQVAPRFLEDLSSSPQVR